MSLRRTRRIFSAGRGRTARGPIGRVPRTLAAGLIGAVVVGGLILFSLPSTLFGRVPRLTGLVAADAPAVAVVDGGTLRLDATSIRLLGVVAPARGTACYGQDGVAYDCGAAATRALAAIINGHAVACRLDGRDAGGFAQGRCEAAGVDINRAIVTAGWARAQRPGSAAPGPRADAASTLTDAEGEARASHRGFWDGAVPSF